MSGIFGTDNAAKKTVGVCFPASSPVSVPSIAGLPKPLFAPAIKPKVDAVSLFAGGNVRTRIPVINEDLLKLEPSATVNTLNEARELILTTNIDNVDNRQIVYWGAEVQKKYAELVEKNFVLFQSTVIAKAKDSFNTIIDILTNLNVEEKKKSIFDTFKKTETFDQGYKKLKAQIALLENTLPALLDLEEAVGASDKVEAKLLKELEIVILAASFILNYLKDNALSALFLSRVTSLVSTKTSIIGNDIQRKAFSDSLLQLVSGIQDTLRVDIPIWYENCLSYFSIKATNDIAKKNEILELLSAQQTKIVQKLKK